MSMLSRGWFCCSLFWRFRAKRIVSRLTRFLLGAVMPPNQMMKPTPKSFANKSV